MENLGDENERRFSLVPPSISFIHSLQGADRANLFNNLELLSLVINSFYSHDLYVWLEGDIVRRN